MAKNYLREGEIEELNRRVVMFLDFAEDQARRQKQILLKDRVPRRHDFLNFIERVVLPDSGKVSRESGPSNFVSAGLSRRRSVLEHGTAVPVVLPGAFPLENVEAPRYRPLGSPRGGEGGAALVSPLVVFFVGFVGFCRMPSPGRAYRESHRRQRRQRSIH